MNLLQQSAFILPEIILTAGLLLILIIDVILKNQKRDNVLGILAALTYIVSFFFLVSGDVGMDQYIFAGQIHVDGMAVFARGLMLVVGLIAVIVALHNPELKGFLPGEFQLLLMGSIIGGMFMTMASNMVMVYLGIEFVSILSYLLTAAKVRDAKAFEGAIKYVLFGAVSSGVLLFGLSYLFGMAGSLDLAAVGKSLRSMENLNEVALIWTSFAFVIGGLAYKISVAPFHSWCPDVYEGAATPVTTFFSVGPKVAGFAILIRIFEEMFSVRVSNEYFTQENLYLMMGILSAVTMTIGNFAALRQSNVKRLLAYSSIAHAGYLLSGFSAYSILANKAVLFYLLAYVLMNSGAFLVAMVVGTRDGQNDAMEVDSFSGLVYKGRMGAFWASAMTVFLFSLTGLPPFVGFIGKYYIFNALIDKQIYWLAIIGALNTVVSLYYYARILKSMFFAKEESIDDIEGKKMFSPGYYVALGIVLLVLTITFGIYPEWVIL